MVDDESINLRCYVKWKFMKIKKILKKSICEKKYLCEIEQVGKFGPFLVIDLQTNPPFLKKSCSDFRILDGDFMILNDGLCYEKNGKPKKKIRFLVFDIRSI